MENGMHLQFKLFNLFKSDSLNFMNAISEVDVSSSGEKITKRRAEKDMSVCIQAESGERFFFDVVLCLHLVHTLIGFTTQFA